MLCPFLFVLLASGAPAESSVNVAVTSTQHLTSTGLWLRKGQKVKVHAEGAWSMWAGTWPETPAVGFDPSIAPPYRGCSMGALVGYVGVASKGTDAPICLDSMNVLVAKRDGLLFLGPNDGGVFDNAGTLQVSLVSEGTVAAPLGTLELRSDVAIPRREIEVYGEHVGLLLPGRFLTKHRAAIADGLDVLDRIYQAEVEAIGATPYGGNRILFVPDASIAGVGLMVAGNPVRFLPEVLGESTTISLLHLGDPAWSHWSWAHELGHDFTMDVGMGRYMIGGFVESWANVPGLAALGALDLPEATLRHPSNPGWKSGYTSGSSVGENLPPEPCSDTPAYLASGSYEQLDRDPWLGLCMLFELQEVHGDDVLLRFLKAYAQDDPTRWPDHQQDARVRWAFFRDAYQEYTGSDPTETLVRWHIPGFGASR